MKRNSMDKVKKVIEKEFDEMDAIIFATERGILLNGNGADLATLLCTIINQLYQNGMPKDMLEDCFKISLKEPKEIIEEIIEKMGEVQKKMEKGEEKDEPSDTNR